MLPMNNCGMSNTIYDSKPDDKRAPGWRSRKIIMEAYSIRMGEPAKDQRLNEVGSTPFSLPLDAARLTGQHIGPLFSHLFQALLDL